MPRIDLRGIAASTLVVLELFGLNSMFGELYRNGYIARVQKLLASADPRLPGSDTPLMTKYLGLPVVDDLLALATVLWANVTDGSAPALSLYAFQFSGQLVPIFLIMMVEGSRMGHTHHALYYSVFWGYTMQTFGYAATMPLYAMVHLFTSPTVTATTGLRHHQGLALRDPASLTTDALIPAFAIGYFLPTVFMAWPVSSSVVHQWLGAAWQGFPLYVVVVQRVFRHFLRPSRRSSAQVLSKAYGWAFGVACTTQLVTYGVILGAKLFPDSHPKWALESLTFASVFRPNRFHSGEGGTSMADAMHDFFRWDQYVGSAAVLVWAVTLELIRAEHMNVAEYAIMAWDVLRWSALAGPAGAAMRLLQRRDWALLQGEKDR